MRILTETTEGRNCLAAASLNPEISTRPQNCHPACPGLPWDRTEGTCCKGSPQPRTSTSNIPRPPQPSTKGTAFSRATNTAKKAALASGESFFTKDKQHSVAWPWYQSVIGGIFDGNSWPPIPADLEVNDPHHPVTAGLPHTWKAPVNEWYAWNPNPATNKNVKVLVSLAPSNFPIGIKDVLTTGPVPVVWTNTNYKMLYINMGHGDKIFTSPIQNHLIEKGLHWLLEKGTAASALPAGASHSSE